MRGLRARRSIAAGHHVDVLEIDAASHTGVDDAREIIEGVGYRPVSGRYKIYIIDEVHMMSKSAFNALLKTLEEPPDNVKFIFATTEIRKVPVTILSRCQRFDLRRVSTEQLATHLQSICERESISADSEAITAIARAAEGSVRDSLSLLDQAAAMTADRLTIESVTEMLGRPGRSDSIAILDAAMRGDAASALAALAGSLAGGAEPDMILSDLLDLVHRASLKAAGGAMDTLLESEVEAIETLSGLGIARLGRAWQMLLKGHGEIASAPQPPAAAEMLVIRLSHLANMPTPGDIVRRLAGTDSGAAPPPPRLRTAPRRRRIPNPLIPRRLWPEPPPVEIRRHRSRTRYRLRRLCRKPIQQPRHSLARFSRNPGLPRRTAIRCWRHMSATTYGLSACNRGFLTSA